MNWLTNLLFGNKTPAKPQDPQTQHLRDSLHKTLHCQTNQTHTPATYATPCTLPNNNTNSYRINIMSNSVGNSTMAHCALTN